MRLAATLLILVSFLARHASSCRDGGGPTLLCEDAAVDVHDCCAHEEPAHGDDSTPSNSDGRTDGHLCIGSHVFFVHSPKVDAPCDLIVAFWAAPKGIESLGRRLSCAQPTDPFDVLDSTPTLPLRAELHVYLI